MARALPALSLFLLCACWRAQVPAAVEVERDEPPPALPPAPPPPLEPSLFAPWHYEGRCPIGMTLVEGGQFSRAQVIRLNDLLDFWTTYDFAAPIEDFCLAVQETSYLEYWNCVRTGYCKEDQDRLASDASSLPSRCVYGKAECPEELLPLAIGMLRPNMAKEYCAAREARLPTVVEWYWAALGGNEDRHYPWGNEAPTGKHLNVLDLQYAISICEDDQVCISNIPRASNANDGYSHWAPTDAYPAGAGRWGQLNMLGNVPEFALLHPDTDIAAPCGGDNETDSLEALDLHGDVCYVHNTNVGVRCAAPARER